MYSFVQFRTGKLVKIGKSWTHCYWLLETYAVSGSECDIKQARMAFIDENARFWNAKLDIEGSSTVPLRRRLGQPYPNIGGYKPSKTLKSIDITIKETKILNFKSENNTKIQSQLAFAISFEEHDGDKRYLTKNIARILRFKRGLWGDSRALFLQSWCDL